MYMYVINIGVTALLTCLTITLIAPPTSLYLSNGDTSISVRETTHPPIHIPPHTPHTHSKQSERLTTTSGTYPFNASAS